MKNKLNLFRQYAGGLVKFLFTITFLLTLCVGQMWGVTFTGGKIYFRNDVTNWSTSNIQIFVHQGGKNYTWVSGSMSSVSNTKLYYINASCNWGDFTGYRICGNSSAWGSGSFSDQSSSTKYTNQNTSYGLNSGSIYLITPASASNGCAISPAYYSSNSNFLKYTATAKVKTSTDGSSYTTVTSGTWPATVNIRGTYLSGDGATGRSDAATSSGASGTYDAVATGLITMSYSSLSSDWAFAGWGTGTTPSNTNASYEYNISAATTVYAFFKKKYTVTFNANGHGSAPSSQTIVAGAKASTPTAPTATGYTFGGWYKEAGCTNAWNFATDVVTANTTLYAKWTAKDYTVTLDKNGGDSDGEITTTYNSSSTSSFTAASYASYSCDGYFTADDGGTMIIDADGNIDDATVANWLSSGTWVKDAADITLYAHWTYNPTLYDVTFGVGTSYTSLGSLSAEVTSSGVAISNGDDLVSGTGVTFTASPNTGYVVEGWYTDAACTEGKHDAGETTYSIASLSSAVTVYVKFVEKTWSVAFAAGTGGTVTTPAATPQTVGQVTGISIAATPGTGYTFASWSSSSGGSFTSGTSTNSNTFKPTANTTVTASFNETKSTITVTTATSSQGTLKFGSTSKSWGATASLGVATTQSITATAAAGFRFVRWDLSGAAASASTLTNATITLKADGSGSTGTATAVFAEDLSSPWIVAGGNKIVTTGTTWRTTADANNTMLKKTGHSTESVVYFTVPISTVCSGDNNGNFQFKIYNTSTSKWYGLAATGDSYYLLKAEDGTEKSLVEGNKNIELRAYVTGDYEFKLDYSTSTPKLTVTWPVFNQVRISAASPTDATNTGNFDLSDPVSNVRTVTRSLKANTTYTFKIMYNSDWYGYNSGTFTRSTSTSSNSRTLSTSGGNLTLTTDYAGDYTFRFNQSTKAFSVDFPTAYKVTYSKGTVDGSSSSCSAKDIDNGNAAVTSNSTWVKSGNRVVLIAPAAKTGYTYDGWFNNNSGTGDAITPNANCTITVSSAETYYACYHENLTAVIITTDGHGTITTPNPNESPYSLGVATMQDINASANTGYHWNTWTVSGTAAVNSSAATQSNKAKGDGTVGGTGTVTATFSPNTYRVHFHRNGGAGEPVYQNFTYDVAQNLTANSYTKAGYSFAGWAQSTGGDVEYANSANISNLTAENGVDFHLYAKWTPNPYTVVLDKQTSAEGYGGNAGTVGDQTVTFDATPATVSGTMPTAKNGWAFLGFYSAEDGEGRQFINPSGEWVANAGDTISGGNWVKPAGITLYAYYKQAEITGITFSPAAVVAPNATITATPTISPTPTGTTNICWRVLYSNDNPLDPQPTMTPGEGNSISFSAKETSGTYKVEAVLHLGGECEGTTLDSVVANFLVAGDHEVTVQYKDASGNTLQASGTVTGKPLEWSEEAITAPDIFGYTFARWEAGDGVTISTDRSSAIDGTSTTTKNIYIKAVYDGRLTAVYNQNQMIYFKNTLGWENVYVNFYSDSYWNNPKGSGNEGVINRNKHMIQIGESDIYYYDYGAESISPSLYVSFTDKSRDGVTNFWGENPDIKVVYPANYADDIHTNKSSENGFKAATPMFVPLATQEPVTLNSSGSGKANYYNAGYWTTYTQGTGYTLEIYNNSTGAFIKSKTFTSADDLMPMKATVDLEGGTTYKFQLKRSGDIYYGNSGTMTYANHGSPTPWDMTNGSFSMCKITTNAAGDYTFHLSYSGHAAVNPHYRLRMAVDYPVSTGDYRLVYSDAVQTKPLTSAIVTKENDGTAIVSFFVRHNQTPVLRIQQASVDGSGNITWNEYPTSGTPTNQITGDIASAIDATGVYNFNLSMDGSGAMSVASAEPYTGNYYIRTDAANSKWDNYRTDPDHLMTYSEYSITHGGYSHYYTHWVNKDDVGRKNVKFVIANDYSPCISDTLARETASGTWANIATFMEEGGDLKRSANVRFMWNSATNEVSRAYIDGAQEDGSQFLLLLSDDSMIKQGGATKTQVTFNDNGNWLYEANISALPNAQIKLKSTWGEGTTIVQYFKGASDATETLVGGSGDDEYNFRLIYDFKTNRLLASYVPATGTISTNVEINADVMFVREHQGDIAQLTFSGSGAISDIKTAYGVMRFNKWTINNKDKSTHDPLPLPQPSRFERDIFYVSFPFRVNLEEVFGFGTYGTHWIIEEYDGASRAEKGFWADTKTFWKFITNRKGKFLEPNKGYILALDLDELGESSSVWANTDQVELYFPSYGTMPNITSSSVTYEIPAHTCNIGPRFEGGDDRRIKDSHWNVMSVPTYINTDDVTFANNTWITAGDGLLGPNFLYTWNMNDNTLSATSGKDYTYKAMHAYIVQYCGNVTWSTSVSPATAPRRNPDAPKDVEYRLELSQNDVAVDQTFIRLSDDEHVTTGFEFNYDMSKEFNKTRSNIYTFIGTEQVAGNIMPMTERTTVVPVGVIAKTAGDYTFAIPEGTNGVGVTLVDIETGIRTSLSALDYTVNLGAGTYNERFVLEISPVQQTPTGIENSEVSHQHSDVRKVLIDGILYIVKDGKMFDATGALVK